MAYIPDLADYDYDSDFARSGTKAVGWLSQRHDFPTASPSDSDLELLWLYGSISVAKQRGGHACEFCPMGTAFVAERNGQTLSLSTAEIRVFSNEDVAYAAPGLIYHYVAVHHYKPPEKFLQALRNGPRPPDRRYFERLGALNLGWSKTSTGEGIRGPYKRPT